MITSTFNEKLDGMEAPEAKQLPFYQLLEQALPDNDEHDSIKDLTDIIPDIIQDHAVIDWTEKNDVKREIRKKIKKQLRVSAIPKNQVKHVEGS